jgi:hypothetical protein
MTPDVEGRLRAHAAAIVAAAGVPHAARDDLLEELLGHLLERWEGLVADGVAPDAAAEQAIASFGTADQLAPSLRLAYHSRLWASTVGVLLPMVGSPPGRPSAVGWLRLVLGVMIVIGLLGVAVLAPTLPLFHLVTAVPLLVLGIAGLALAFIGLGRGQRWALRYAIAAAAILFIEGIITVIGAIPGAVTIPLGSILAALALLVAWSQSEALAHFVSGSARLSAPLSLALVVALFGPSLAPRLAALPDPTQATAEDLDLAVSMTCGRADVTPKGGPILQNAQIATVQVDATWRRTDLLPSTLAGLFAPSEEGDTSALRVVDTEYPWVWSPLGDPVPVDLTTGEDAGWWGSTSPSVALIPQDVMGSLTVAYERDAPQPGHTLRTTWRLYWADSRQTRWPRVEVFYAHLDRFLLYAQVECNGISHGVQVDPATVQPAEVGLPPVP